MSKAANYTQNFHLIPYIQLLNKIHISINKTLNRNVIKVHQGGLSNYTHSRLQSI